jgi:hypothetical protein
VSEREFAIGIGAEREAGVDPRGQAAAELKAPPASQQLFLDEA